MNIITLLIAVAFFVAAITVGSMTENTTKNTLITWALLAIGGAVLGLAFTL